MRLRFLSLLTLSLIPRIAFSQQAHHVIKGTIVDAHTKEQMIGATIFIPELKRSTSARLDGSFVLENIQPGTYHFQCSYVGYLKLDTVITVRDNIKISLTLQASSSALNEVVVTGANYDRESENSAKRSEQLAPNTMNIISAKAIRLSPDITIANVMQRISGVSVERSSSGEGRYAIIRGMDQRYNNTLINGIKIPSPDNKNRFVPLDLFPADLVERVEVSKTLTPNMEADAVGGTVNMVMKKAPNQLYVNASAATGVSQNVLDNGFDAFPVSAINKKSPYQAKGPSYQAQPNDFTRDNLNYTHRKAPLNSMGTLSLGNRFLNDKLGIMLGGSYQNTYKSYHSIFMPGEYDEGDQLYIKHAYFRDYATHITRSAANANVDYKFNDQHKISLQALYADLQDAQARLTTDSLMVAPRTGPGIGQVWNYGRSKYQEQTILTTSLRGDHELTTHLHLDWTAVYSNATNNIPDWAEYEYDGGTYGDGNNNTPVYHAPVAAKFNRDWWHNTDRDLAGYLNLAYSNKLRSIPYTVSAGGLYRNKHRDNTYDHYILDPIPDPNSNTQAWTNIYNLRWTVSNPAGSNGSANNYRADEDITAGYAMVKFNVKKLEAVAGVRYESTTQSFDTNLPETSAGKSGNISYGDVLPSLNLKYAVNAVTNVRFGYYAAITRPNFFDIVPYNFDGDNFAEKGNSYLKHSTAQNLNLRYEWYPRANEQLLLGAFYKNIQDPIEYGFTITGNMVNNTFYQPNNFGNATNYGFEFVYEKYLGNFGLRTNYTYTHSSVTDSKFSSAIIDGISQKIPVTETRPLQGQAAHIANAALLYKNQQLGLDAQLAWQYTGKRIVLVSPYYGFDYWQQPTNFFDISAEKRFAKHFAVFVKVQNLLNAKYEVDVNKPINNSVEVPLQHPASGKTLAQRDQYGQTYQLGLRFTLKQ
ncbi:TonB-dependent receptor [Chitinophaga parva]|uniref:TonB-dependent receptor n=1 Tax=Chitinophaga parva TaxID=2169414 RepID=A0A2T7BH66_9BACT|nr:TonB-dependent receptor [Chitinophaga parva]PUZ25625.1 TonB-dependent receptor [Chitinophaga parva]